MACPQAASTPAACLNPSAAAVLTGLPCVATRPRPIGGRRDQPTTQRTTTIARDVVSLASFSMVFTHTRNLTHSACPRKRGTWHPATRLSRRSVTRRRRRNVSTSRPTKRLPTPLSFPRLRFVGNQIFYHSSRTAGRGTSIRFEERRFAAACPLPMRDYCIGRFMKTETVP